MLQFYVCSVNLTIFVNTSTQVIEETNGVLESENSEMKQIIASLTQDRREDRLLFDQVESQLKSDLMALEYLRDRDNTKQEELYTQEVISHLLLEISSTVRHNALMEERKCLEENTTRTINNLIQENADLKDSLGAQQNLFHSTNTILQTYKIKVSQLSDEINTHLQTIQANNRDHHDQLTDYQVSFRELRNQLDQTRSTNCDQQGRIFQLENEIKSKNEIIAEDKNKIELIIAEHQQKVRNYEIEIGQLKDEVVKQQMMLTEKNNLLLDLKADISSKSDLISALQAEISDYIQMKQKYYELETVHAEKIEELTFEVEKYKLLLESMSQENEANEADMKKEFDRLKAAAQQAQEHYKNTVAILVSSERDREEAVQQAKELRETEEEHSRLIQVSALFQHPVPTALCCSHK